MVWVDIATIIMGVGSIFAIIVSLYAIRKNQEANEINVVRQNNSDFINCFFELKRLCDSELALSLPFRIENIMDNFFQDNVEKYKSFNDFKIFVCDTLRNAKIPYMKIVSNINALANEQNTNYAQKCGAIITEFHLANNDFYREAEDFLDSLSETLASKGNFILLTNKAKSFVDKLCDLVYKEKVYSEFISAFTTELRKQTEITNYFSFNKILANTPIFENACNLLIYYGFIYSDNGKRTSIQLEEANERIGIIKTTRLENLLTCLKVYEYKLRSKQNKKAS